MRIGIDCRIYGASHGHMGKYMENFISFLGKNEDTNEYVLFFNDREFGEFTSLSSKIRTVKTSAKIGSFMEQIVLPYELSREKLDLVLFSGPHIPFFFYGKSIVMIPDLVSYFYPEKHLKSIWKRYGYQAILRESIRKSCSVITFSEVLKRDIIEIFDIPEEKIYIVPPMSSEAHTLKRNEAKQFLSKENLNKPYILFVWELREYKNIPRFLQAYSILLAEDTLDMDLVLVWKEDPTYHEIRSALIGLGLQNRVHIYNILEDETIGYLYQNASLYILPSLYEGSEQAILEPISYNLPIVSATLPCITTILGKDDAIFFRPMSIPDIWEALKKAMENPIENERRRDMSLYSISSVSMKILDILNLFREEDKNDMKNN